jgi:hypothetical protein
MTTAPQCLLDARTLAIHAFGIPADSVGIVAGNSNGEGYHSGYGALHAAGRAPGDVHPDYSVRESVRDSGGLTEYASAMDFGLFTTTINGHTVTLRDFTLWLVGRCKAGDPDAADIREIIYTPDGKTVQRYDRLGIRSTGDSSHLTHTHVSLFRDSVKVNRASMVNLIKKYLAGIGNLAESSSHTEDDMPLDGLDRAQVNNSERYLQSIFGLTDHAVGISDTVNSHDLPSPFVAAFRQLLADVNELKTRPAGSITLAAADLDAIAVRLAALVPNPATIAKAVLDEDHKRTEA